MLSFILICVCGILLWKTHNNILHIFQQNNNVRFFMYFICTRVSNKTLHTLFAAVVVCYCEKQFCKLNNVNVPIISIICRCFQHKISHRKFDWIHIYDQHTTAHFYMESRYVLVISSVFFLFAHKMNLGLPFRLPLINYYENKFSP